MDTVMGQEAFPAPQSDDELAKQLVRFGLTPHQAQYYIAVKRGAFAGHDITGSTQDEIIAKIQELDRQIRAIPSPDRGTNDHEGERIDRLDQTACEFDETVWAGTVVPPIRSLPPF